MLTPNGSNNTVPFLIPEQTPKQESRSNNSEYSPGDSGTNKAIATKRFIRVKENTEEIQVGNIRGKEKEILDEEIAEDKLGILSNKYTQDTIVYKGINSRTVTENPSPEILIP
jgi:hypothetical protein